MRMVFRRWWIALALLAGLPASLLAQLIRYDFHCFPEGPLPADWQASPAWSIRLDPERQINMLRNTASGESLALAPVGRFQNGVIQARLRGNRSFGIAWRVQDPGTYYLLAYDPVRRQLRLEIVENHRRTRLGSAANVRADLGGAVLKIRQSGPGIQAFLDNQLFIDSANDAIGAPGRVGLWSAAGGETECEYVTVEPGMVLSP